MYKINNLFDQRYSFAIKLQNLLNSQNISKSKFCREINISRPTLDKLLNAKVTNKTNFEKYAERILAYFNSNSELFINDIKYPNNRLQSLKYALNIPDEYIIDNTDISPQRLHAIKSGEEPTLAELRDIAFCYETSVNNITGREFFDAPISMYSGMIKDNSEFSSNGFWGHIGILLNSQNQYMWFPITEKVYSSVHRFLNNNYKFIVVPCMNNKLLLINSEELNNLILLDEAIDCYSISDCELNNIDDGEIPLVIYEAIEDYIISGTNDINHISLKMQNYINNIISTYNWDEDTIYEMINSANIYYKNSHKHKITINLDDFETLTSFIETAYIFSDSIDYTESFIFLHGIAYEDIFININNISMIELPLLKIENKILESFNELYDDSDK